MRLKELSRLFSISIANINTHAHNHFELSVERTWRSTCRLGMHTMQRKLYVNYFKETVLTFLQLLYSLILPTPFILSVFSPALWQTYTFCIWFSTLYPKNISDEEHDHQYSSSGYWGINIHGGRASLQIHPATRITVAGRAGHAQAFRPPYITGPVKASISEQNLLQWQPLFTLFHFSGRCTERDKERWGIGNSAMQTLIGCQVL